MEESYLEKEFYYRLTLGKVPTHDFFKNSLMDGISFWNLETPDHNWLNDRLWTILGYDPHEMLNNLTFWKQLIFEDDLTEMKKIFAEHKFDPAHIYQYIIRFYHKDGSTIWMQCNGKVVYNAEKMPIRLIGICDDITKIKVAEETTLQRNQELERLNEELTIARERLNLLVNNNYDIIYEMDLQGTFSFFSPAITKHLGYQPTDLLGKNMLSLVHPDDCSRCSQMLEIVLLHKQSVEEEICRVLHHDGSFQILRLSMVPVLDASGNLVRLTGNARNVDKYKEMEAKVAASEKEFRSLFESIPIGISIKEVITDENNIPVDFRYVKVNPEYEALTGMSKKDLVGHTFKEIYPNFSNDWLDSYFKTASTGETTCYEGLMTHVNKHQKIVSFTINDTLICTAITDISEHVNYERNLRIAIDKAEESERIKTNFLANMSHELRTPLNAVIGFSELLNETQLDDDQHEYLSYIENGGHRILNIVNELLAVAEFGSKEKIELNYTEININERFRFLRNLFNNNAVQKGFEILTDCPNPDSQAYLITDEKKLQNTLISLIDNAVKFTKSGSVSIGYKAEPDSILIFVKDTGIGIPKDKQGLIFDNFFQVESELNRTYEGVGLGLSVSKAYVNQLGGEMWVESEEGIGSTFYFTLPAKLRTKASKIHMDSYEKSSL